MILWFYLFDVLETIACRSVRSILSVYRIIFVRFDRTQWREKRRRGRKKKQGICYFKKQREVAALVTNITRENRVSGDSVFGIRVLFPRPSSTASLYDSLFPSALVTHASVGGAPQLFSREYLIHNSSNETSLSTRYISSRSSFYFLNIILLLLLLYIYNNETYIVPPIRRYTSGVNTKFVESKQNRFRFVFLSIFCYSIFIIILYYVAIYECKGN